MNPEAQIPLHSHFFRRLTREPGGSGITSTSVHDGVTHWHSFKAGAHRTETVLGHWHTLGHADVTGHSVSDTKFQEYEKPEAGTPVRVDDVDVIFEAVSARQNFWPEEPLDVTLKVVLLNIGDRFAAVTCLAGEWSGLKADFPPNLTDVPTCPNGHVCIQDKGLRLGWIDA